MHWTCTEPSFPRTAAAGIQSDTNTSHAQIAPVPYGVVFVTSLFGQSLFVGTWKPDPAKTKFSPGDPGKNDKVVIEQKGDYLQVTATATNMDGSPYILKYTVPLKGGVGQVQASAGHLDGITSNVVSPSVPENTFTRAGKQGRFSRILVGQDGKTIAVRESGIDFHGKPFNGAHVMTKQ